MTRRASNSKYPEVGWIDHVVFGYMADGYDFSAEESVRNFVEMQANGPGKTIDYWAGLLKAEVEWALRNDLSEEEEKYRSAAVRWATSDNPYDSSTEELLQKMLETVDSILEKTAETPKVASCGFARRRVP